MGALTSGDEGKAHSRVGTEPPAQHVGAIVAVGRWVRVTAVGDRTGTWAGEVWQTGFSIAGMDDGGGALVPVVDDTLGAFDADPSSTSGTWSKGTYLLGWEAPTSFTETRQGSVALAFWTFLDACKALMPADMRVTDFLVNAYQDNGKVINGSSIYTLSSPIVGSASATTQMPPEVAVVASLRTGGRGPRNRGRMYLPFTCATNASGLIASASRTTITTAAKTMFDGIVDGIPGASPAVVHAAGLTFSSVTRVQVGDHWDAQRRRQNKLPETRTTVDVDYTP